MRLFDVREGEGRATLLGFAAVLLLIITGHTILEAARDALLLAGPGPRALGLVYIAIAVCAWPAATLAVWVNERLGARQSLAIALAVAACLPVTLFLFPSSTASAMAVYVVSGLIGSTVVPQFWTFTGRVLTAAQGRRLFGLIAAAGVLGGTLGSGSAAAVLLVLPVKALLLVSAACFVLAAAALLRLRGPERADPRARRSAVTLNESARALRNQPLLSRIALGVVVSTATLLVLDYCFKSSVARSLRGDQIGPFVARYYLLLNGLSLVVQLFAASALVRRLGVTATVALTPLLLVAGALLAALGGGALGAVLVMKAVDGGLRFSVHRIGQELVYLPVPVRARLRFKPIIDGALARGSQTITGAILLLLGGTWVLAPRPLAIVVAVMAAMWLAVALTMRRPYLALLRSSIASGSLDSQDGPAPLDLESAQLLVQHLASADPLEVVGAMNALARRERAGFIPALVLLHSDAGVLTQALEHFAASSRTDWIPLARRILGDGREEVRMAAARALAMHGGLDLDRIAGDVGWRVRGYAAVVRAIRDGVEDVLDDEGVGKLLGAAAAQDALDIRLGMLAAIADAPATPALARLLLALDKDVDDSPLASQLVAQAATRQHDPRIIPRLVERLATREGREAVRAALVSFGDEGLAAAWWALQDGSRPRSFRVHVPKALTRFGTRAAALHLVESIETEEDGQVRYKSIRALELLVAQRRVPLDRARIEKLATDALIRHFRLLALRLPLPPVTETSSAASRLLAGLLDDKLGQSVERAFRLLAIAHPREDFHRLRIASLSRDPFLRANAGELLDALLRHGDQEALRELLRIVTEDLPPAERAARSAHFVGRSPPSTPEEALAILGRDHDLVLAGLARACSESQPPAVDVPSAEVSHA